MKKIGFLLITLLITSTWAMAQPGRSFDPEERAKRQTEELTERLGLSNDQAKKVEAINLKYGKKMGDLFREMRESGDMDRDEMMKSRKAMQDEQTKEMKAVLDAGQMKKYEAYLVEQAERRQHRGPREPLKKYFFLAMKVKKAI